MDPTGSLTPEAIASLGKMGAIATVSLAAMGSALGAFAAGAASVGAWKRCFMQSKSAPFMLLTFCGAPLSQTIYGMILMFNMIAKAEAGTPYQALLGGGIFAGTAMGISAWLQGRVGAAAAEAQAETGQGFTNYLAALGIIETVAIFVMVFVLIAL